MLKLLEMLSSCASKGAFFSVALSGELARSYSGLGYNLMALTHPRIRVHHNCDEVPESHVSKDIRGSSNQGQKKIGMTYEIHGFTADLPSK